MKKNYFYYWVTKNYFCVCGWLSYITIYTFYLTNWVWSGNKSFLNSLNPLSSKRFNFKTKSVSFICCGFVSKNIVCLYLYFVFVPINSLKCNNLILQKQWKKYCLVIPYTKEVLFLLFSLFFRDYGYLIIWRTCVRIQEH